MKRAVAQFLGGRQAEASTTAESMWNRGMWAAAARRAGVLGWWYSTTVQSCPSQILDHFQGQGKGKGERTAERLSLALAGLADLAF
jgi:hypothetical protein